ncbi:lipoprotein heptaprenylglyceryl N-acetyltransferase LhaT [Aeribacillus alveayuensis]|uniref:Membrane protein YpjA n=1 Tax=Aeribacillus alveayuensis TaxID=279215 RepID=A0ABT9VKR7_9BACI|nr:putative membrane protein YpjA [Bacillus alveayuensis]
MNWLYFILRHPFFLLMMLMINISGTIYGYIWYGYQLKETPIYFLPFVPDSPTASLFFVIVLIGFLFKKHFKLFEALALITLFKYGIWAVVMNILVYVVTGEMTISSYMLIFSHLGMAIQGILYAPFYRFTNRHLIIAAIWTLHNEIIDYVFHMMPRYSVLNDYMEPIGYFTFWLSIVSILIAYYVVHSSKRKKLSLS